MSLLEDESDDSSIQVLNLSFPRCGTMSIQAALNKLGYHCWHSTTCFGDKTQCNRWTRAIKQKYTDNNPPSRQDFDLIFGNYTAVSADPPAFAFVEELVTAYPDSKIILIERDEDAWYASFAATTQHALHRWDMNFVSDIDPDMVGPVRDMQRTWEHLWWRVKTEDEMKFKARDMYREHNALVRRVVPPERLLNYKLESGWEPLCGFLEKEVPDAPFPKLHDRETVRARYKWINVRGAQIVGTFVITKVVLSLGVCAAAWWLSQRYYLRKG